ncbi:hypothetical protein BS78_01G161200 [Paspalum vaginatum]|nr:hypothetical protein BS78_01G161200 [Paspalum vaginatum]
MQETERRTDHVKTLKLEQVPVQQQSSLRKLCSCSPGLLAFAAAAASVALLLLSSSSFAAAGGSAFARRTALFLLSNAIFLLLAADCRCTATAAAAAASSKQEARRQRRHQAAARCAAVSCVAVPCSASGERSDQEGEEKPTMSSAESWADDEQDVDGDVAGVVSKLELVGHAAQEEHSVALELETVGGVGEPTCVGGATAQELDRLEIHELNKKFDDFIQSRRIKWMEEEDDEASLLLQHV